ncbi:MAG: nuclear transport factor 2 family protein [Ilumatobacteraceae bacterium]
MRGWTQIEAYYRELPTAIPTNRVTQMRVDDLTIDTLADVALAFGRFHLEGETSTAGEPFIAEGGVTFAMHRAQGSWRVIHYQESCTPPQQRELTWSTRTSHSRPASPTTRNHPRPLRGQQATEQPACTFGSAVKPAVEDVRRPEDARYSDACASLESPRTCPSRTSRRHAASTPTTSVSGSRR